MALVQRIVGSGISPLAATNIQGDVTTGIVAAGSTQGTATLLGSAINDVATTAASTGVVFPTFTQPGDVIVVYNVGANSLTVYPATGESINNGATNAGIAVATTKTAEFIKVTNTRWAGGALA